MKSLLNKLMSEPVALAGFGAAVETLLIVLGVNRVLLASIAGVLSALLVLVRQLVTPVSTVQSVATAAAGQAALSTAAGLTSDIVGAAGEVTAEAQSVIDAATTTGSEAALTANRVSVPDAAPAHAAP